MSLGAAAVCFDAYDTLVTLDDPVGRLMGVLQGHGVEVTWATAAAAFAAEAAYYRVHSLEGADEARLEALRHECGRRLAEVVAREQPQVPGGLCWRDVLMAALSFRLQPGVLACLQTLKSWRVPMAVVSNWDCCLTEVLASVGLTGYFVSITASALVGCEKPDPRTWAPALAALNGRAERIWHVGDEPVADGQGALAAGLRPVLVGGPPPADGLTHLADLSELPRLLQSAA